MDISRSHHKLLAFSPGNDNEFHFKYSLLFLFIVTQLPLSSFPIRHQLICYLLVHLN